MFYKDVKTQWCMCVKILNFGKWTDHALFEHSFSNQTEEDASAKIILEREENDALNWMTMLA